MQKIERYERDIFDFEVSPFETIASLHLRSELEKEFQKMSSEEQLKLLTVDVNVINKAQSIVDHLKEVYDFSTTKEPEAEWWWHLDKVANGKIKVTSYPLYVTKDVAL